MYEEFFKLAARLQVDPGLIPAPDLYNYSTEEIYATVMERLAQPLPTGQPSPFTSKAPTTAHAVLASNLAYMQSILGRELNLVPDRLLLTWFQILGASLQSAEFPVINLTFRRTRAAIVNAIDVTISPGIEIRSTEDSNLAAITQVKAVISGADEEVTIPARLNQPGSMTTIRPGEFSILPRSLSYIETVYNDGTVVNEGRSAESLSEAVLRIREGVRTGSLGRDNGLLTSGESFSGRCVTDRDYAYWATRAGATKVNVIRGSQPNVAGYFPDLVSLACYPESSVALVKSLLNPIAGGQFQVVPAEIIPVGGTVSLRASSNMSQFEAFNIVATAIQAGVNPPFGKWGDQDFDRTLATAIEDKYRILAVPQTALIDTRSGKPLSETKISEWSLLEVQGSLVVEMV